jgi:hypothetical protein
MNNAAGIYKSKPIFRFKIKKYDRDLVACSNKRWTSFGGASR